MRVDRLAPVELNLGCLDAVRCVAFYPAVVMRGSSAASASCSPCQGCCISLGPRPCWLHSPALQAGTLAQTTATPSLPTMCGPSTLQMAPGGRSGPLGRTRCRALSRHTRSMRRPAAPKVRKEGMRVCS